MGIMEQRGAGYEAQEEQATAMGLGHGSYPVSGWEATDGMGAAAGSPDQDEARAYEGKPMYRYVLPGFAGAAVVNGYHQETPPGYNGVHVTPGGEVYKHTGWTGM
jgi:hypothetical protein